MLTLGQIIIAHPLFGAYDWAEACKARRECRVRLEPMMFKLVLPNRHILHGRVYHLLDFGPAPMYFDPHLWRLQVVCGMIQLAGA